MQTSHPVRSIKGAVRAPGDKSCSHRALMFGAIASGESRFRGLLEGDDVLRTAAVLRQLGASAERSGDGDWIIHGVGDEGFRSPTDALDLGNSGTGARLMLGAMAGRGVTAQIRGDQSLSRRPMGRVLGPLREMGVQTTPVDAERLPFSFHGGETLSPISHTLAQASAQVKSAILLAGLAADGTTRVAEPRLTRDHTERMLAGFGAEVGVDSRSEGGRVISVRGGQSLHAVDAVIPGDPSSAAFLAAAAIVAPEGEVLIEGVMSNETRDGFFQAAQSMGAVLGAELRGDAAGERIVDMTAASAELTGRPIPERLAPAMIDEFPILAVLAAFATGPTLVTGAEELRVKESDRIRAIVSMLRANGVEIEERPDGFEIEGCGGPPPGGGFVETRHDHRIAMSALVMGVGAQNPVTIDDASMIATSYPDFMDHMRSLGADLQKGRP